MQEKYQPNSGPFWGIYCIKLRFSAHIEKISTHSLQILCAFCCFRCRNMASRFCMLVSGPCPRSPCLLA